MDRLMSYAKIPLLAQMVFFVWRFWFLLCLYCKCLWKSNRHIDICSSLIRTFSGPKYQEKSLLLESDFDWLEDVLGPCQSPKSFGQRHIYLLQSFLACFALEV
jgi:hypothetical protein